jgi:hypothetical protein
VQRPQSYEWRSPAKPKLKDHVVASYHNLPLADGRYVVERKHKPLTMHG